MARTPAFDREAVIRAARQVFWAQGYDAASVPALEKATGLSRSSLYNSFGSKRGLFDAAVRSYLDDVIGPRLRPLRAQDVAPEALEQYLDGLAGAFADPASVAAENGCLLINAAAAPIGHDPQVAAAIEGYRAELQEAVGTGLRAAGVPDETRGPVGVAATTITGLIVAAFALVRIAPAQAVALLEAAKGLIRPVG